METSLLMVLFQLRNSYNFQFEACVHYGHVFIDGDDCVFLLQTGLERRPYNCQNLKPEGFPPKGYGNVFSLATDSFFWAAEQKHEAFYHVAPKSGGGLETKRFPGNLSGDIEINGFISLAGTFLSRSRRPNNRTRYLVDGEEFKFPEDREISEPFSPGERKWPPFISFERDDDQASFRYSLGT